MSTFEYALALLPAAAAVVVMLTALADRRDASALHDICTLDENLDSSAREDDDRESCAA